MLGILQKTRASKRGRVVEPNRCRFRIKLSGTFQRSHRSIEITHLAIGITEIIPGLPVIRLRLDNVPIGSDRGWVVFRRLQVNLSEVAALINQHRIPLTVVVGQYDKVIPPKNMRPLLKKVNRYVFETPEVGHTGLIAESGGYFNNLSSLLQD